MHNTRPFREGAPPKKLTTHSVFEILFLSAQQQGLHHGLGILQLHNGH